MARPPPRLSLLCPPHHRERIQALTFGSIFTPVQDEPKLLDFSLTISSDPAVYGERRETSKRRRSRRSTGSSTPLLLKAKNNYTGPGFASLPPGLARSPTARLVPCFDLEPDDPAEITPPSPSAEVVARERRGSNTLYDRLLGDQRSHAGSFSRLDDEAAPVKRKLARRAFSIISRRKTACDMGTAVSSCGYRTETIAKEYAPADVVNFLSARGNSKDLDRFEKAYAENDVPVMVELIPSVEKFDRLDMALHPWAAAPQHVGALAMFNLGALASVEGDQSMKEAIRSAGAIPLLVKQLASRNEDCSDAALLALSFLSVDYPRGCLEMFDAGIFKNIIPLLRKPKNGVRAAAAQTARNIYVLEVRYRRAFRDLGGCQPLVDLLALPPGPFDPSDLDVQLESVEHLADFIINNGDEIPDCVTAIKLSNVVRRLEPLLKVEGNVELRRAAQQLYLRVAE